MEEIPGVTFYAVSDQDSRKLLNLQQVLMEAGIPSKWTKHDYHGENIPALDVYAHGNVVAPYLRFI